MQIEHAFFGLMAVLMVVTGVNKWSEDRKAEAQSASCYAEMAKVLPNSPDPKVIQAVFHCDKVSE